MIILSRCVMIAWYNLGIISLSNLRRSLKPGMLGLVSNISKCRPRRYFDELTDAERAMEIPHRT
jgi:hypothetical protein